MTYDQIILDEVDSTMAEAARRAPGLIAPTWIMARKQTAARGRRGNAWDNPAGNFSATLLMKPGCSPQDAALRSFVAANALHATCSTIVDPRQLAMKWPNDVLYLGGKVAGILLESAGKTEKIDWLAIGIGANLASAPKLDDAKFPPVHLGGAVDQDGFLNILAAHFAAEEIRFQTYGFDPVRRDWLQKAAKLGEVITARTTREEITGTFDTVDEAGQLVLLTPKGRVTVPAADVYF